MKTTRIQRARQRQRRLVHQKHTRREWEMTEMINVGDEIIHHLDRYFQFEIIQVRYC